MITKYGKVIITEDKITWTGFEYEGHTALEDFVEWAKDRLDKNVNLVIAECSVSSGSPERFSLVIAEC